MRLTGRGTTLLVVGTVIVIAAALIGEPDLVWVGFLLVLLPLAAVAAVLVLRPRLFVSRSVEPAQVALGGRPRAVLDIENSRVLSQSSCEFRDACPGALGSASRFALAHGPGRWRQAVGYEVRAERRGHFDMGPLDVTQHDPFGLARLTWRVPGNTATLRVTPRMHRLSVPGRLVGAGATGDTTPQRMGHSGQDDVLVREHRHGDDMRRVHWRMTAKQGELMVRVEEQPWDPSATLVIDNRQAAHPGTGPDGGLEWSISAVASIASALMSARCRVTIVSAETEVFSPMHSDTVSAGDRMLAALVDLGDSARESISSGLAHSDSLGNSQTILAALGFLSATDAAALRAVGTRMQQAAALVPDPLAWGLPPDDAQEHLAACRLLTSSGWIVQQHKPGDDVPAAWDRLMARAEAS